ncbi:MAG TPA: glycosyltransferase family 4 protein [Candidatus Paceibacterota bacterium]|nr:glycosyltransferase family 4 protein [Candidatus Paceibacterota bacterium]
MKLVLATPLYPPEIGGPATYAKVLEEGLPKRGIEVELVKFSDVRHLSKFFRHLVYTYRVWSKARHADMVFVQDTVSCGLPALIAARLARVPLVVRVPGDYAWEQGRQRFGVTDTIDLFQEQRYGVRVSLLRLVQRTVVRHADRVVVPSRYFAYLVSGWGVAPTKLHVIYNGIKLPLPNPQVPQHAPVPSIVSAGRLVEWKGIQGLIGLLKLLPEWHLIVVGEGPMRSSLQKQAQETGVADRVRFTGSLAPELLIGWYQAATAFVLNTSFESFSFQIAEAMAAGIPIIATEIGSIPELIEDRKEGVLVRPNDLKALKEAVESVRAQPELWQRRVLAAKEKAEMFSIDRTLDTLVPVLQELISPMPKKVTVAARPLP